MKVFDQMTASFAVYDLVSYQHIEAHKKILKTHCQRLSEALDRIEDIGIKDIKQILKAQCQRSGEALDRMEDMQERLGQIRKGMFDKMREIFA